MITFLTILFFIFSALLIFVVVYQYRIKNTLKGRQSPEKEKLLNWLVTGVGVVFFIVVFLLAFTYNKIALENKAAIESINKATENQNQTNINQTTTPVEQIHTESQNQNNPAENTQTNNQ